MKCDYMLPRHEFQNILIELNPSFIVERIEMRPDADVELSQVHLNLNLVSLLKNLIYLYWCLQELINSFKLPHCPNCQDKENGFFKPDIVFFGDNVPKPRVDFVYSQIAACDCLLVVGRYFAYLQSTALNLTILTLFMLQVHLCTFTLGIALLFEQTNSVNHVLLSTSVRHELINWSALSWAGKQVIYCLKYACKMKQKND